MCYLRLLYFSTFFADFSISGAYNFFRFLFRADEKLHYVFTNFNYNRTFYGDLESYFNLLNEVDKEANIANIKFLRIFC